MIALDTNVLVRFLVRDDPEQTRRARAVITEALEAGEELFVSEVVLCELVWVLSRGYRVERVEIADTLERLALAVYLRHPDRVGRALRAFRLGRGDLADYLIHEDGRAAGASATVTLDRRLHAHAGFQPS